MDLATASNEELVEECLRMSAYVHGESRKRLRAQQPLELDDLLEIKRAAARMNRSFAQYVKRARAREDRLLVELRVVLQAGRGRAARAGGGRRTLVDRNGKAPAVPASIRVLLGTAARALGRRLVAGAVAA